MSLSAGHKATLLRTNDFFKRVEPVLESSVIASGLQQSHAGIYCDFNQGLGSIRRTVAKYNCKLQIKSLAKEHQMLLDVIRSANVTVMKIFCLVNVAAVASWHAGKLCDTLCASMSGTACGYVRTSERWAKP